MSRAAPGKEEPGSRPSKPGRRSTKLVRRYRPYRFPASYYWRLLAQRCSLGLLEPFQCSACGGIALDPVGRIGKREFLCESCADSTEREAA
jgi:hypothetical protein